MSRISKDLAESHHLPNRHANGEISMFRLPIRRGRMPKVAVVGGGVAGLRCTDVLLRSGAQSVTIFEARDRLGGRVHQAESAGILMDLGPNWIHGTDGNPILRLAKRTEAVLEETPETEDNVAVYDSNGQRKTDEEATEMSDLIWEIIVKAFKYSDELSEEINPQKSLLDYFETEIPKLEKDPEKVSDSLKLTEMWGPFIGDPVSVQSLKFFWLEQCIDGPNPFVANTYKDILAEISRTAVAQANICLNTEIVRYEVSTSSQSESSGSIALTAQDGKVYQPFDEVVITCPLGWLKRNLGTAFPQSLLPPRLSSAITNMGYGRLEKLYVTFPQAFWLSDTTSNSTSNKNLATPKIYPRFSHFLEPDYVPHPPSVPWIQSPISLAHLPGPTAHATLLFYLHGPCATTIVNSIAGISPNSHEYYETLDKFAHPFYSRLPNYVAHDRDCKPLAFLATQWQNDRFAGNGSYTNFPVGLEEADKDIECMRDAGGLGEKHGLWLAGEHTAPMVALGTTTGAYWSGEGVARRILKKWGIQVDEDGEDSTEETEQNIRGSDASERAKNDSLSNGAA